MQRRSIEQLITMFSGATVDYRTRPVELMRADLELLMQSLPPERDAIRTPCTMAGLNCMWFTPPGMQPRRTILYVHGGGYVVASTATYADLLGRIAIAAEARVLGYDYRLAPEHPFPAALEDSVAVYDELLSEMDSPNEIVVIGDSAGGGLALALLTRLRDQGLALPAAAAVISPWTDLSLSSPRLQEDAARDPVIPEVLLRRMAEMYAGPTRLQEPSVSPLFAELHGLPPLLIQVGSRELLLDDSQRLTSRAAAHGVDVQLNVWDGMIHVWHLYAGVLAEGEAALAELAAFVRAHTTMN